MKKWLAIFILCSLFMLFIGSVSLAVEITNPILKKLVEKGVLTEQEARSVMQEMEKEAIEQEKAVEKKIDKKVAEVKPADKEDIDKVAKALKKFNIGFLWYLSYQNGQNGEGAGEDYSRFAIKRGYINIKYQFTDWFHVRVTPDVNMMEDDENNFDGSVTLRLKYMYGQFNLPDYSIFTKPYIEVGMVHMPWLDFEEHVNFYRCQGTMFLERNNIFNSADLGVTAVSLFGGMIDEEYQHNVNHYYAGRYGSIALGVYNGGGYHASEENENKPFEGRLTMRPLPDTIPGFQLSYFGLTGKGNKDTEPDWTVNLPFVSYEHEYVTLTGQYYWGTGNQKGSDEYDKDGYSFFTEIKPSKKFSIIGRYDYFNENKDVDDADNVRYIAGIAYHFYKQHKNMLLLDYDHVDYKDPLRKDDKRIQLTLQVKL